MCIVAPATQGRGGAAGPPGGRHQGGPRAWACQLMVQTGGNILNFTSLQVPWHAVRREAAVWVIRYARFLGQVVHLRLLWFNPYVGLHLSLENLVLSCFV